MSEFIKFVKNTINHWYLILLAGLLFVFTGFYSFTSTAETYLTLAVIFGIAFLVSGISETIFALANRQEIDNWGWTLVHGLFTLLMGWILVGHPGITMVTIPFILGFALLFRAIAGISFSLDLKNYKVAEWGYLMTLSILGVIFALFILWHPMVGGLAITIWIGLSFLTVGAFSIFLSLKLRKLNKLPEHISKELQDKLEGIVKQVADKSAQLS